MGSVVTQNDVDDLAGRNFPLHGLMAVAFYAAADHRSVQDVDGGDSVVVPLHL